MTRSAWGSSQLLSCIKIKSFYVANQNKNIQSHLFKVFQGLSSPALSGGIIKDPVTQKGLKTVDIVGRSKPSLCRLLDPRTRCFRHDGEATFSFFLIE